MLDVNTWLDEVLTRKPELDTAVKTIKSKLEAQKNLDSIVEEEVKALANLEQKVKQQFS